MIAIGCMSVRSLRRGGVNIDKFCLFGLYGGLPSFATDRLESIPCQAARHPMLAFRTLKVSRGQAHGEPSVFLASIRGP